MKFFTVVSILVLAIAVPSLTKNLRLDPISDADILNLSKQLHDSDVNGVIVTLDLQSQTTAGNLNDLSPNSLFVGDLTNDLTKPTYKALIALLDNYQKDVNIQDVLTTDQLAEESAFLDAVLATSVIQQLREFLVSKGDTNAGNDANFKQFLQTIWFGRYAYITPDVVSSSGWEHTNVFERLSDNTIVGFHNWVYLYDEENHGDCNYLGYINKIDTGKTTILSMPVDLYGSTKASAEFNIGASPELELALGTLCFLARADQSCTVQGSNSDTYSFQVRSVTINGVQYIETSHPTFN